MLSAAFPTFHNSAVGSQLGASSTYLTRPPTIVVYLTQTDLIHQLFAPMGGTGFTPKPGSECTREASRTLLSRLEPQGLEAGRGLAGLGMAGRGEAGLGKARHFLA